MSTNPEDAYEAMQMATENARADAETAPRSTSTGLRLRVVMDSMGPYLEGPDGRVYAVITGPRWSDNGRAFANTLAAAPLMQTALHDLERGVTCGFESEADRQNALCAARDAIKAAKEGLPHG